MNAFEYSTTVLTHGLMGRKSDEIDRGELEKALNEMGAQGWELVKLLEDTELHRERDGHLLVFKRALASA